MNTDTIQKPMQFPHVSNEGGVEVKVIDVRPGTRKAVKVADIEAARKRQAAYFGRHRKRAA